ncbi:MAG: hypothetical protein R2787_01075 [Saprospiraceae bacterium]
MMANKDISCHHLTVSRTARFFVAEAVGEPQRLLIVCHGYAQSVASFLQEVSKADLPGYVIVAPEGLSRFYRRGFEGDVVASWMTREDRLAEIRDQVAYLDQLANLLKDEYGPLPLDVLGFSQGVPTVCRWLAESEIHAEHLVLWQGMVPETDTMSRLAAKFQQGVDLVLGNSDPFFTPTREGHLQEAVRGIGVRWHRFEGGHEMEPLLLKQILKD